MIVMGSVTVPGSATVPIFLLPTGLSNFTVFQQTGGTPVYVGSSTALTVTNGLQIPVSPANIESYNSTAGGRMFYATTGSTVPATFQFIVSTAQ